jgi:ribosomal protein S17
MHLYFIVFSDRRYKTRRVFANSFKEAMEMARKFKANSKYHAYREREYITRFN